VKSIESNYCNSNAVLSAGALLRLEGVFTERFNKVRTRAFFARGSALADKKTVHSELPIASKTKLETVRFLHRAMGL
jgi:hypothetical protein